MPLISSAPAIPSAAGYYEKRAAKRRAQAFFQYKIHLNNVCLYSSWFGAIGYRFGALANAVKSLFSSTGSPSLTTPAILVGTADSVLQAAIGANVVTSLWEFVVATVVFGKDAHKHRRAEAKLSRYQESHTDFCRHIKEQKDATQKAKQPKAIEGNTAAPATSSIAASEPAISLPLTPPSNIETAAYGYLKYEAARADLPGASKTLKHSSCMFGRDGIAQGASIGCTLASLWEKFKVAEILDVAAKPINLAAASIVGGALTVATGLLHLGAGVLARLDGKAKLAMARLAKTKIADALQAANDKRAASIAAAVAQEAAAIEHAGAVAEALLRHAKRNEKQAIKAAEHEIFVGNARIAYGSAATIIGGVSLTLLVVLGGVTTGGLILGIAGTVALGGWLAYASHRNRKHAEALKTALATADPSLEPLSLDDAIQQAVAFFDRGSAGGQCKAARQLVKHALLAVGMRRTDFHPLRFGAGMGDGVKTPVTEALKVKIHHHVAGDGARLAVPQANSQ